MTSNYQIEDFRKRLLELRAPAQNNWTGAYHLYNATKKPFKGIITQNSFRLEASSPLLDTSFYIEGTYKSSDEGTTVDAMLKKRLVLYVVLRPICLGFYLFLQLLFYKNLDGSDFIKVQFLLIIVLMPMLADVYYKQVLVTTFNKELKIK